MFQVQIVYSACCVIKTQDIKILCDPWFTQGIHGGTWFHNPILENPIDIIGECDYIYISHIHEDHYDKEFLELYCKHLRSKNKTPKIMIAPRSNRNFLEAKIKRDNFVEELCVIDQMRIGDTSVILREYKSGIDGEIDSCIFVENRGKSLLNINDISFKEEYMRNTLDGIEISNLDCLLTKQAGAGPYPQMYYEGEELRIKHQEKVAYNKQMFKETVNFFEPEAVIPFAGDYVLGGGIGHLNEFRGMYDTIETQKIDERSIPIDIKTGREYFDIEKRRASKIKREETIQYEGYARRLEIVNAISRKKWYPELSDEAVENSLKKNLKEVLSNWYIKNQPTNDFEYYFFQKDDESKGIKITFENHIPSVEQIEYSYDNLREDKSMNDDFVSIFIDSRLFLACTKRDAHWNNVFGGSQCIIRRHGETNLCRRMEAKLWFLHI